MGDGSFVVIGTAKEIPETVEEEIARRKKNDYENQVVKDKQGRRRFHGAFTGGFSAGFFNTVGSKEGWAPTDFVSSRSGKRNDAQQRPEDFMDEEDLEVFGIAPRQIVTTEPFAGEREDDGEKLRKRVREHSLLAPLEDIIRPTRMTIGMQLLNKMGWKEGQGIGPRVARDAGIKLYGCSRAPAQDTKDETTTTTGDVSYAPRDVEAFHFTPKDDVKGVGYRGLDPTAALHQRKEKENKKLMGMSGQAFGTGALEDDDDDIYDTDHLSNYNRVVDSAMSGDSQFGWTGAQSGASDGSDTVNSLFRKVEKPLTAQKVFPPPLLPKDFKPYHQQQPSHLLGSDISHPADFEKKLDARERGQILGESPIGGPSSVYGLLSGEDRKRLLATRDSVEHGRHPTDSSQRRIPEQAEMNQTEWQSRQITKERYKKTARQFEQLAGAMASRFTSSHNLGKQTEETTEVKVSETTVDADTAASAAKMKMFGLMTRQIIDWYPVRLVCKRFNVPDPYPKSGIVGIPKEKRKVSSLDQFISVDRLTGTGREETKTGASVEAQSNVPPKLEFQRAIENQPVHTDKERQSHSTDRSKDLFVEHKEDEKEEERPSMDIFKAIFAESEESESSEDEDKDIGGDEEQHGDEQKEQEVTNTAINGTESPKETVSSIPDSTETPAVGSKSPVDDSNRMEVSEDDESAMYGPSVAPLPASTQIGNVVVESDSESDIEDTKSSRKVKHKKKRKHKKKKRKGRE